MRLATRFTIVFTAVACLVLGVRGFLDARRTIAHTERELSEEQQLLAELVAIGMEHLWEAGGGMAAARWLATLNEQRHLTRLKVYPLAGKVSERPSGLPLQRWTRIAPKIMNGDLVQHIERRPIPGRLLTYAVLGGGQRPALLLELARSLKPEQGYFWSVARHELLTALVVLAIYAAAARALGAWLVGRPVSSLVQRASQLDEVVQEAPPAVAERDEAGQLAWTIDVAAEHLQKVRREVEEERGARLELELHLEHANRLAAVGTVAAGLIHDLGTPLNVISGRAALMSSGDVTDDEITENADIIREQTVRMTQMARQLLTFARPEFDEPPSCDVDAVIREHAALLNGLARKKRVRIRIEDDGVDGEARVGAGPLRQVLNNLLMNAIDAMPNGGVVTVNTARAVAPLRPAGEPESCVSIQVADEGVGIPADKLVHIFDAFFTTKPESEGTGLGLAVCRNIVRRYRGRIELDSAVGEGSRFTVFFPFAETNHERATSPDC